LLKDLDPDKWDESSVETVLNIADVNQDGVIDYTDFMNWVFSDLAVYHWGATKAMNDGCSWTSEDEVAHQNRVRNILHYERMEKLGLGSSEHYQSLMEEDKRICAAGGRPAEAEAWLDEMKTRLVEGLAKNREIGHEVQWKDEYKIPELLSNDPALGRQILEYVLKAGGFEFVFDQKYSGKSDATCLDCPILKYEIWAHRIIGGGVTGTYTIFPIALEIFGLGQDKSDVYAIGHKGLLEEDE
jgi:hypothetical protein